MTRIPRTAHFVFGLRPQVEPFHLVQYLAIASCAEILRPDTIMFHCDELPYGFYWDLARPLVDLHRIGPVAAVTGFPYDDPVVRHYSYAHQADFVRLDVLAEHGGVYADIDTLFVAPPPGDLWESPCVLGREADVFDPRVERSRPSVSNALVMAEPGARFVERWRAEIGGALDGSWSAHSCFLADDLSRRLADAVRVEPERTFHAFPPTPDGLRRLLVEQETDLTGIVSIHLAAHLWWEESRRDFSAVYARQIDEQWIRAGACTYAAAARAVPARTRVLLMDGAALRYIAEDAPTGYGDAADRLVRATRAHGTPVEYRGWSNTLAGVAPALVPFSRDTRPRERAVDGAPTVAHLVPEYYPLVQSVVPPGPFVAHTVWESDRLPRHWPELLDATDLVIVPTEWNRTVFVESGVRTPVEVVPHVATAVVPGDGGAPLGVSDDDYVFYSIGRWDERKAIFLAVRAYLDAFTADDPVVLVVKTGPRIEMPPGEWGAGNPMSWTTAWQVAALVRRYRNPARVRVEAEMWTDDRIAGLHARGDCYLTLARGEGWGIGAFDATAYGNPVVATGWGGFLEYLDADTAFLVDHSLAAVEHNAFASYSPDQQWAAPDLDHAVELLREVLADPSRARKRAAPASERVLTRYAPARVAQRFLDVLS